MVTVDDSKQHGIGYGPSPVVGLNLGPLRVEFGNGSEQLAAILANEPHLIADFQRQTVNVVFLWRDVGIGPLDIYHVKGSRPAFTRL